MKKKKENVPKQEAGGRSVAANLALALCAVVVIICIAIALTVLCRPIYYVDLQHLDIPARSGISAEVCRKNYDVLIDYNLLISPDELVFPDFSMSETGRIHFAEVKRIFVAAQVIALVGLIAFGIWLFRELRRQASEPHRGGDYRWLRWTCWVALGVVAVVGGGMALNWDMAFVVMHKILFRNDFWLFNETTDPIIKILPDTFFLHCAVVIILLVVLLVAGCRLLAAWLQRREARREG